LQVQYPNALRTMEMDLSNIRLAAQYLSKTVSHSSLADMLSQAIVTAVVDLPSLAWQLRHDHLVVKHSCCSPQELKFDLVSPVDELAKQIRMEFDFEREADFMDTIGSHLRV
jgi:predicted unusual protein kinase regulating ubiquinone biosynthesis (AarF/ABC1/UbiB family)